MQRILIAVFCLSALALGLSTALSEATEASPATVVKDTGCLVKDADGDQIWDPECKVHLVYKYDAANNVQFVHYQDKGRLPDGAPRPQKAVKTQAVVNCNGCLLQGTYEEILTPSGHYSSSGPN
jgi:hypothetical protein